MLGGGEKKVCADVSYSHFTDIMNKMSLKITQKALANISVFKPKICTLYISTVKFREVW